MKRKLEGRIAERESNREDGEGSGHTNEGATGPTGNWGQRPRLSSFGSAHLVLRERGCGGTTVEAC